MSEATNVLGKPAPGAEPEAGLCAVDPDARHGPYYEWSRRQEGRLVHSVVTPAQAQLFTHAMASYREIQRLLKRLELETAEETLNSNNVESD